jgi:putative DNA primase/helicase
MNTSNESLTDFNDLARVQGLEAVKAQLDAALSTVVAPLPTKYPHTESGWAAQFADMVRHEARFVKDLGNWRWFDGQRWVVDDGNVMTLGKSGEVSRALTAQANHQLTPDHEYEELLRAAQKTQRRQCRENIIALAKAEPGIAVASSQFDGDPMLLNCQNGTIDLRTGSLQPHNPDDMITKILSISYDLSAVSPRWEQFLSETLQDEETISFAQRFVGYCLTGDDSEHVMVFCHGPGANGKTVLVETIQSLLGDYAVTAPTSLLMTKHNEQHPCDRMPLRGARMAAFSEVPSGQRFDEATVKSLTGGDTITARGMRENFSTFKPTHKIWICGNHKPIVRGQDEGIWRRLRLIPFERVIPEGQRDHKLKEKLRGELPGILAWAVRGCLDWQQQDGLGVSAKVKEATAGYRAESDRLAPFLAERCTLAPGNRVAKAILWAAYESWCDREGERPLDQKEFAEQLRLRGVEDCKVRVAGESVRGWRGIGIVERGHEDTGGQQFPDNGLRESHEEINRESVSSPVLMSSPVCAEAQREDDWQGGSDDVWAAGEPQDDSQ